MLHHMHGGEEAEDRHRSRERDAGDAERAMIDHPARGREPGLEHEIECPGEEQESVKMNDRASGKCPVSERHPISRCEAEKCGGRAGQRHVEIKISCRRRISRAYTTVVDQGCHQE